MKSGHESQTAVMVCAARAVAHGRTRVSGFHDPVALQLLPEPARQRVEQARSGTPTKSLRERVQRFFLEKRASMAVPRTVAIDEELRAAASPQVVILGAGLDGRAWRMPELANATVFEVDHPDSQREKRARVAPLTQSARDVRFVPVDFTRDRLEDALAAAGHDPARQTTWLWEGVVMYLERASIEATLRVVAARSTPHSRLVILYASQSVVRRVVGTLLWLIGEPFRSSFTADEMRALLAALQYDVVRDEHLGSIGAKLSPELAGAERFLRDLRIVTAMRR